MSNIKTLSDIQTDEEQIINVRDLLSVHAKNQEKFNQERAGRLKEKAEKEMIEEHKKKLMVVITEKTNETKQLKKQLETYQNKKTNKGTFKGVGFADITPEQEKKELNEYKQKYLKTIDDEFTKYLNQL